MSPPDPGVELPVRPGDVIAGKFRVERQLGKGGMGVVVAATHVAFGDKVAIKLLLPKAAADAGIVERFIREGRAARSIRSEHVVQVTDVDTLDSGAPYMVMEHLDGIDLSRRLRRDGQLGIDETVELMLQACEALAEAHALGIVHRDLKPGNLFLTTRRDGSTALKVLDFGISKGVGQGDPSLDGELTSAEVTMGSPPYSSPEQLRSARSVDARADLWSLGIILYQCFAGKRPFVANDFPTLCARILTEAPPPLRRLRSDVPPGLAAAVLRCLEKDPEHRFQNVGELAVALHPFASKRGRMSVERILRVLAAAGQSVPPVPHSSPPPPPSDEPVTQFHAADASGGYRPSLPPSHTTSITSMSADVELEPIAAAPRAVSAPEPAEPPPRSSNLALAVLAAAAFLGILGGAFLATRPRGPTTGFAPAQAATSVAVEAPAVTATPPVAAPSMAPSASAVVAPKPEPKPEPPKPAPAKPEPPKPSAAPQPVAPKPVANNPTPIKDDERL